MARQTVYGKLAYAGFAKAIGMKLGLRVKVEDGANAAINKAGTITLPGMSNYQTEEQFAVTCGTVVHELAHQFYESHKLIDPQRSRLEHDCLNAVLDVADESWIAHYFATLQLNQRPGQLLDAGNLDALKKPQVDRLYDWNDTSSHAWKLLVTGLLAARLPRPRMLTRIGNYNVRMARRFGVDARAVYALLRKARRTPAQDGRPTPARFPKLIDLAKQLAVILAPFTPPPGAPEVGDLFGPGDGTGQTGKAGKSARAQGTANVPANADVATGAAGDAVAAGKGGIGASQGAGAPGMNPFDTESFNLLSPAVRKVAARIANDGDAIAKDDGMASGSTLGQAYRIVTDGHCLARWQDAPHADGLAAAVLLDCSGSMYNVMAECAGIARAFALGMKECGPVKSIAFGTDWKDSNHFDQVRNMGGTRTTEAVQAATDWLAAQSAGAKWLVVVTDGEPDDQDTCNAACTAAHKKGIKIVAIGLGCKINMAHATSVTANDTNHLAIELDQAAARIERGW